MDRSKLIFEKIFSDEDYEVNEAKPNDFSLRSCRIICHPCPNAYEKNCKPRPREERPASLDDWFLSELMEIEINGTRALNESLSKYNISGIGNNKIDATIKKIHEQYERETSIDHIS